MRTQIIFLLFVLSELSLSIFCQTLWAQGMLRTDGTAIVDESGDTIQIRAMGLGGWMLQEGYMLQTSDFANAQHEIREKITELIGEADTDLFYDKWLQNHVRKNDIDSLARWGFNAVRLPMHYQLYTLPIEQEPVQGEHTWLNKGFELTDSLVSWCKANKMYVLLDLHAAPGGQGYESAISDYDPDKPSLWESKANRNKTVALWKKLADHYKDEPAILGYDLINETNWNMSGNSLLRVLFKEITDSIRRVDDQHMIFIEGNWFANDFTGLTPPWDDNMVYSPHKYWSFNDRASIQWVLDIRNTYQVPIFFGESGENSNAWFTDAIRLFEENGLGWAWWPLKKIESISCPLSIKKTPQYEYLLNYWKGNGPKPSPAYTKAALWQLTENLKAENCRYQKDVIDAMFRQVRETGTIPFRVQTIPGKVYAPDYSMGGPKVAYFDDGVADYHVSTGNYTAWNSGWSYRNDGVDIEPLSDTTASNGYAVGWIASGEWLTYDVDVKEPGVYDAMVRVAAQAAGGKMHFETNGARISEDLTIPATGGWDKWSFATLRDLVLTGNERQIRFVAGKDGFNLASFTFIKTGETTAIPANFLSAKTRDAQTIELVINKTVQEPLPAIPAGFSLTVNSLPLTITNIVTDPANPRILILGINEVLTYTDMIRVSYSGNQIASTDGTVLQNFSNKIVINSLIYYHPVPGKIESEDFHYQQGVQIENCTDTGGGKNIGYLDAGDYLDYFIDVENAGEFNVEYRTAAEASTGKVRLLLYEADGSWTELHTVSFNPTAGWQIWRSTFKKLTLPEGRHRIRMEILGSQFNMNWFEFTFLTSLKDRSHFDGIRVFPNPAGSKLSIDGDFPLQNRLSLSMADVKGNPILTRRYTQISQLKESFDLTSFPNGWYVLYLYDEGAIKWSGSFIKQ